MFRRKISVAVVAAGSLLVVLCFALSTRGQKTPAAQAPVKDVPDNPAEHKPPAQPIPYSHKTHIAFGLECKYCHTGPDPGRMMTFPSADTCMSCHMTVATNKPAIQKLTSYASSGQAVPWVRVYVVTPGVTWTHRKHLDAGVKCETCHGEVSEMDAMSEVTSVTAMGACINCHKAHSAPTICQTCHVWPGGSQ